MTTPDQYAAYWHTNRSARIVNCCDCLQLFTTRSVRGVRCPKCQRQYHTDKAREYAQIKAEIHKAKSTLRHGVKAVLFVGKVPELDETAVTWVYGHYLPWSEFKFGLRKSWYHGAIVKIDGVRYAVNANTMEEA